MSFVLSNNGTILHSLNANDLLDESSKESAKMVGLNTFSTNVTPMDPMSTIYLRFLNEGIKKSSLI